MKNDRTARIGFAPSLPQTTENNAAEKIRGVGDNAPPGNAANRVISLRSRHPIFPNKN